MQMQLRGSSNISKGPLIMDCGILKVNILVLLTILMQVGLLALMKGKEHHE